MTDITDRIAALPTKLCGLRLKAERDLALEVLRASATVLRSYPMADAKAAAQDADAVLAACGKGE